MGWQNKIEAIGKFINESCQMRDSKYSNPLYRQLGGQITVERELTTNNYGNATPKEQSFNQMLYTKETRDELLNAIDSISNHHIATTIKSIIEGDCFRSFCDKDLITISYLKQDGTEHKEYTESIRKMLKKTAFFKIFQDCLTNEGINYGEMFFHTECKYGKGIISISEDYKTRDMVGIYEKASPVGFLDFNNLQNKKIVTDDAWLHPDKVSHFLLSYEKLPMEIKLASGSNKVLPNKIRCGKPILMPVIELIQEYNALERMETLIEINKITQPIILGVAVSNEGNISEMNQKAQSYSALFNANKNSVVANLHQLDMTVLSNNANRVIPLLYPLESGADNIRQVKLDFPESNFSEQMNRKLQTIANATGIPKQHMAETNVITDKGDTISTSPRYSRMLASIQQCLSDGFIEMCYKHLVFENSNTEGILIPLLEKDNIQVIFSSTVNVDDRLEAEQMMLKATNMSGIMNVLDTVAGSPNIPAGVDYESFLKVWKHEFKYLPNLRDVFTVDQSELQAMEDEDMLGMDQGLPDEEIPPQEATEQPPKEDKKETGIETLKNTFK